MSVETKRVELWWGGERIAVDCKRAAFYVPPAGDIRVKSVLAHVQVVIADKLLQLNTPCAVKVGLALAHNGAACNVSGDVVTIEIGLHEYMLLPHQAVKLGGVICRKADRADDFQRAQA